MAPVFAAAVNAFKFAGAACKLESAFHAYLLAGSDDFALEGAQSRSPSARSLHQ